MNSLDYLKEFLTELMENTLRYIYRLLYMARVYETINIIKLNVLDLAK